MGHIDEGDAEFFLKLFEFQPHLVSQLGVEGAEGFVEEEDLGLADDRAGQGDALALAAGKLRRLAVHEIAECGHLHNAIDAAGDVQLGDAFHAQPEGDVFVNREMRKEGVTLKNLVHIAAVGGIKCHILAVDENPARAWRVESADESQAGGLAASGGAEEGHELAGVDCKTRVLEGFVGTEALADLAEFKHRSPRKNQSPQAAVPRWRVVPWERIGNSQVPHGGFRLHPAVLRRARRHRERAVVC